MRRATPKRSPLNVNPSRLRGDDPPSRRWRPGMKGENCSRGLIAVLSALFVAGRALTKRFLVPRCFFMPNAARGPPEEDLEVLAPLRETRSHNFIRDRPPSAPPHSVLPSRRASRDGPAAQGDSAHRRVRAIKPASGKKEQGNSARTKPLFITTANLPSAKFRQFPTVTARPLYYRPLSDSFFFHPRSAPSAPTSPHPTRPTPRTPLLSGTSRNPYNLI